MRSLWTWLAAGIVFLFAQGAALAAEDNDPHATGALRPTAEERAWADAHMVTARRVKLNKLGLDRINAERRKNGQAELPCVTPAAVGSEVSAEPAADATPADSGAVSYVDNSTLPYFPPIRSQGSLGS